MRSPFIPAAVSVARRRCSRTGRRCSRASGDFVAELVDLSITGTTEWGEWYWHGRHPDGTAFALRGVIILTVRDDVISDARLYMEPVEATADDIGAAVRELYKPPDSASP